MSQGGAFPGRLESALRLLNAGNVVAATKAFQQLKVQRPNDPDVLHYLGVCLYQSGNPDQAIPLIEAATRLNPQSAYIYNNLGSVLMGSGRASAALDAYSQAIALKADYGDAHFNRGNVLAALRRFAEASDAYDKALAHAPGLLSAWVNKGNTLLELRQFADALRCYEFVLGQQPAHAPTLANRARALLELDQPEAALQSAEAALRQNNNLPDAHFERGNALAALGRFDEALMSYRQSTLLRPALAVAHFAEAVVLLQRGDYADGWREFEWRDRSDPPPLSNLPPPPAWRGENANGKSILVYSEQGAGDAIQFSRFAAQLADCGAAVTLLVPPAIEPLIATLQAPVIVASDANALEAPDYVCPILSLPYLLKTSLETLPRDVPYLYASPQRKNTWSARLGAKEKRLRIGLAWSGNPAHRNDRNRSIPLETLQPLLNLTEVDFICLQTQVRSEEDALLATMPIRDFRSDMIDFADTAALASLVDLVISVDTSVAHLAGALGKTTWVLLPTVCDWRWMLERTDSPWYPTVRLFRQSRPRDWDSVIRRVRDAVKEFTAN